MGKIESKRLLLVLHFCCRRLSPNWSKMVATELRKELKIKNSLFRNEIHKKRMDGKRERERKEGWKWPDWAIFESDRWQFAKVAQIFKTFWAIWKHQFLINYYCGYFLGNYCKNLGYFLIRTSGHTGSDWLRMKRQRKAKRTIKTDLVYKQTSLINAMG